MAGLSFHGNLYARMAETGVVQGWNISFAAENTSIEPSFLSTVSGPSSIPGTHLDVWSYPSGGRADEVIVLYQTQGDDITFSSGSVSSGQWNRTTARIPEQ